MKHLPLFYYPTTWVCVDDDTLITRSVGNALSGINHVTCFQSAQECIDFLEHYTPLLSQYVFFRPDTQSERYGMLEHSNVNFNVTDIAKLADMPERHQEITAIMLDYRMPGMDGLTLAEKYRDLAIPKILLTGVAKPEEAIEGLNDHLIRCFIHKGDSELFYKLSTHLRKLSYEYFQLKSLPLLAHLEADTALALSES